MWPRLLAASRSHAELWSLPLLLIATTLPSFDVLCMNRNARVPRAANRGKRAVINEPSRLGDRVTSRFTRHQERGVFGETI